MLRTLFPLNNVRITLPDLESLFEDIETSDWSPSTIGYLLGGYTSEGSVHIHNAWWRSETYQSSEGINLHFMDCTCSSNCHSQTRVSSGQSYARSFCPFTVDDMVDYLVQECEKSGRHTPMPEITFHNVPKCTANTPWSTIERKFRDSVGGTTPGYKVERMVRMWREIFESFEEEEEISSCRLCCGDDQV
uniref:Uncharacterized protein n=1 Tax=Kwoniella bestiolae CBS 10118 TaxID=1296100 RepID=A0A1B9G440_9TREE|nr:hypothetical protein I302_03472 [Kwoniella bestiolae CBS 10118]OCF25799.1 hypothetical protein I302_03472 [Kwoniella bestiolae CBS 10118]